MLVSWENWPKELQPNPELPGSCRSSCRKITTTASCGICGNHGDLFGEGDICPLIWGKSCDPEWDFSSFHWLFCWPILPLPSIPFYLDGPCHWLVWLKYHLSIPSTLGYCAKWCGPSSHFLSKGCKCAIWFVYDTQSQWYKHTTGDRAIGLGPNKSDNKMPGHIF